jgi:3'-phosphoadenosine 5'-phosphosulfate sulfotransferase (PAPS reductase)/FAD synthetase
MFDVIKNLKEKSVIIYFSTGRDSIVMLDLFFRFYSGKKHIIYFYYYKDIPTKNRFLKYIENKYSCTIHQYPIIDKLREKNKSINWGDIDNKLRDEFKTEWIARGYRKDESLHRRGLLKNCIKGLEYNTKIIYPLIEWSKKHVNYYVKQRKILLPIEYKYGFRDITIYKGKCLLWLYNNFPEDYEWIKKQNPHIEGELIRAKEKVMKIIR